MNEERDDNTKVRSLQRCTGAQHKHTHTHTHTHTHIHTIQVRGDVLKEDIVEELLDLRDLIGLTHGSVNDWLEKKRAEK